MAAAYPASDNSSSKILPLVEILDQYPLSLVDSSFLYSDSDFARDIYQTQFPDELNDLEERIRSIYHHWNWQLEHLIRHSNVQTILGIVMEIESFEEHIKNVYHLHSRYLKQAREGRPLKVTQKYRRPSNFEREMEKVKHLKREFNPHKPQNSLRYLNCLLNYIRKTINEFEVYSGRIEAIPPGIDASENDYLLVGAAVGYALENPSSEVALLTRDSHFPQIIKACLQNGRKEGMERVHLYENFEVYHQVKRWAIRDYRPAIADSLSPETL